MNPNPRTRLYFAKGGEAMYQIIWIDAAGITHCHRTANGQEAANLYADLQQQMAEHRIRYCECAETVWRAA